MPLTPLFHVYNLSRRSFVVLSISIIVFLQACSGGISIGEPTETPTPKPTRVVHTPVPAFPEIVSLGSLTPEQAFALAEARIDIFVGMLALNIEVLDAKGGRVIVEATFTNLSDEYLTIRIPSTFGFPVDDVCHFTDLVVNIKTDYGLDLTFADEGVENCNPDWNIDDFTILDPHDTLVIQAPAKIPQFLDIATGKTYALPPGRYNMVATYSNVLIGFYNEVEWFDMDAWVGSLPEAVTTFDYKGE